MLLFSGTHTARMIAPRLSVKIKACITNVISLTESSEITVKRKSFSTKAIEITKSNTEKTILSISPNSFGLIENQMDCTIERSDFIEKGDIIF